jgi:hypothetical protein
MIPEKYLDGCTCFPDKFGKVSHRHVCDMHDIDYWSKRTIPEKIVADIRWTIYLNKAHKQNTLFWRIIVFFASIVGFIGLSTFGWYFWNIRHRWDVK